jgi:hypothetical protein
LKGPFSLGQRVHKLPQFVKKEVGKHLTEKRKEGNRHLRGDRKQKYSKRKTIELISYRKKIRNILKGQVGIEQIKKLKISMKLRNKETLRYIYIYIYGQNKEK